ncbi:metallophosphoesterase [Kaistia terrae]|uniref:Metallophosphoesterase n=1 Tax=Kaistia terrae TaxID=537017 RepID=A0ABW0PZQ3_9HYPH|nr:metallophosphoesterase [Kaistia terrae]MCX5580782.1 metallophosphoesterase [Kaistia terrae]
MAGYDVIGDIHGHADALQRLLGAMGYERRDGVYRHPTRTVVFAGDFIDRGPQQREVLSVARPMVEMGSAQAVMGNHEFNAIAWATADGKGSHLRPRTPKNNHQHSVFLEQVGAGSSAHAEAVAWFMTLPLWLDLNGLRVVHACWHQASRKALAGCVDAQARLTEQGLHEVHDRGSAAYQAAEVLLKGPEARLPEGHTFHDKDGHLRYDVRLRWWDPSAITFRSAALGMEGREADLPMSPVPTAFHYADETPVLFGHYWMSGEPRILSPRASCLDFSVARDGVLAAYRWSGEAELQSENLMWVQPEAP